ncbi:unnamed protein product [Cylicocyclus nassatus]|uniref:Uncharacterized protein n=1 Tax=Cylicocyclus nassatus TaxID=53992 RepID=A0AA36H438_CYLNA|nr:unnamed protein product [Cylicocyclus nassatus]
MRLLPLVLLFPVAYSLICKDITIGTANGTSFNFKNDLQCPDSTKWCMSINGSVSLPGFSVEGNMGNCETNGFVGALVKAAAPLMDITCKTKGCIDYRPHLNITQCCCDTDFCNLGSTSITGLFIMVLSALFLLSL